MSSIVKTGGFGMFLGKSVLGLTMAAVLATMAAPILFQEPTPGRPDDIAEVLPEETIAFLEVVKSPLLLRDWKEYVGAYYSTKEAKEKACKQMEEQVRKALEVVPEKLLKDLEKGLPSIQRIAFAATSFSFDKGFPFVFVITSSDDGLFKRIVEDDLRVFSSEEKVHQGSKVLTIRKLGDLKLPEPILVAAAGKRLVLAMSWDPLAAVLDRAAGKGKGGDLRQNAMYKAFSATTGEAPVLRGFGRLPWAEMADGPRGPWNHRRSSAHSMDVADAIVGFQKIKGMIIEASIKPGEIAAQTRIRIDPGCRIYDVIRQPAGPKEALGYLPPEAAMAIHLNLKGGKAVWEDIVGIFKRAREVTAKSAPQGRPDRDDLEMFRKEMEREIGVTPEEIAAAVSDEIAFGMVGEDIFSGPQAILGGMLFAIKTTDPAKAKSILEKLAAKIAPYQAKNEGGADYWVPPQEGEMPVFALHKSMVLIGTKVDTLKTGVKAAIDGKGMSKELPAEASKSSKLITLRFGTLIKSMQQLLGRAAPGELPPGMDELMKDVNLGGLSTILFAEEKDELRMMSKDVGIGFGMQLGLSLAPIALFAVTSVRMGGMPMAFDEEGRPIAPRPPPVPIPDAAPLPADQLAKKVKDGIAGLRSDDLAVREEALAALKALGKQVIPHVAEAAKKETDAEAKGRLIGILTDWRAFDAFPDLLKNKVEALLAQLGTKVEQANRGFMGGVIQWRQEGGEGMPFQYVLEPSYINLELVKQLEAADILDSPSGVKAVAARLAEGKLSPALAQNLSAYFAYTDCSAGADSILALRQVSNDPLVKCYLQIAMGKMAAPKARELVLAGFKDADVWVRRASFIAAEDSKDPAVVTRLIELLKEADGETRWNAAFTLKSLTKGRAAVNVLLPDDEVKAAVGAAEQWWTANKGAWAP